MGQFAHCCYVCLCLQLKAGNAHFLIIQRQKFVLVEYGQGRVMCTKLKHESSKPENAAEIILMKSARKIHWVAADWMQTMVMSVMCIV